MKLLQCLRSMQIMILFILVQRLVKNATSYSIYLTTEICKPQLHGTNLNFSSFKDINSYEVNLKTDLIKQFTLFCGPFDLDATTDAVNNSFIVYWSTPKGKYLANHISTYRSIIYEEPFINGTFECLFENDSSVAITFINFTRNSKEKINPYPIKVTFYQLEPVPVDVNTPITIRNENTNLGQWLTPTFDLIDLSQPELYALDINQDAFNLNIKNLTYLKTSANYTYELCDGTEKLIYEISLEGKPVLTIAEQYNYVQLGKSIKIICINRRVAATAVAARWLTTFNWYFTPCHWDAADNNNNNQNLMCSNCCNQTNAIFFNQSKNSTPDFSILDLSQFDNNKYQLNQLEFTPKDGGKITCSVTYSFHNWNTTTNINGYIVVGNTKKPFVIIDHDADIELRENSDIENKLGQNVTVSCIAVKTFYNSDLNWYQNDSELIINSSSITVLSDSDNFSFHKILYIQQLSKSHNGTYECRVSRKYLTATDSSPTFDSLYFNLIVDVEEIEYYLFYYIAGGSLLILLIIIAILAMRLKYNLMKRAKLIQMGIKDFEHGDVDKINPDLSTFEQAELLPYNKKLEFPRQNLKIGKRLGSGAFGVVYEAEAKRILPKQKSTIVAVKTLCSGADNDALKSLVMELKIMTHLGKHLNIVNLLGCITQNLHKSELFLIVEYCKYGCVQSYLLQNRSNFVNQINPLTDSIDPSIKHKKLKDHDNLAYINSSGSTLITTTKNDTSSKPCELTTSTLVSWAFQVARGMDYLGSKNLLHGDLATRNILLCADNIVKICDFGLSRAMGNSTTYAKTRGCRLPIKWLALESITSYIFSIKSDVWSFGITMWELFSLAECPYSNMKADANFVQNIENGYRMSKPNFANQILYRIMMDCWHANPARRPLFKELEQRLGNILCDHLVEHYIQMNQPFVVENMDYFFNGGIDYLSKMESTTSVPPASANKMCSFDDFSDHESNDNLEFNFVENMEYFRPLK